MTREIIEGMVKELGEPSYRAGQIYQWILKGVSSVDEMTNLPKSFKDALKERIELHPVDIIKRFESKDKTVKYLLGLHDKNTIESVLMAYGYGHSACLSTQAGCNMGCAFCASAIGGRARNLYPDEMYAQILLMQKDAGVRISNLVLMGNGEPLDNYENVIAFLKMANDADGINIGYRHISLSTCGIIDKMDRLSEENMPINLCVSLHAPNDEIRNNLMPINKRYGIKALIAASKRYIGRTNRRITFEYALIEGVNSSDENANELKRLLQGMLCHVNLIPINPVLERGFSPPPRNQTQRFKNILIDGKINATVRRSLGQDIGASCGQLRKGYQSEGFLDV